jgi:hypothetical protein
MARMAPVIITSVSQATKRLGNLLLFVIISCLKAGDQSNCQKIELQHFVDGGTKKLFEDLLRAVG